MARGAECQVRVAGVRVGEAEHPGPSGTRDHPRTPAHSGNAHSTLVNSVSEPVQSQANIQAFGTLGTEVPTALNFHATAFFVEPGWLEYFRGPTSNVLQW